MRDRLIGHTWWHSRYFLLLAICLAGIVSVTAWWYIIWQSPPRVFEDMLANNLATFSVTRQAHAGSNSQTIDQTVRLVMGSTNAADWLVTVTQGNSKVVTESIGTPTSGYIRYTHIQTQQKNPAGSTYDFSQLLNIWGKSDNQTKQSLAQLFNQTVLDISNAPLPPIGNVPSEERQNILTYMQNQRIFVPAYQNVKRQNLKGHVVYTYTVAVHLGPYVRMMQAFAHDLGIATLDTVDANQYSTLAPISLMMSVDRASHQLVAVSYPSAHFSQTYTDWGLRTPIPLPTKTIPASELQKRIQSLQ